MLFVNAEDVKPFEQKLGNCLYTNLSLYGSEFKSKTYRIVDHFPSKTFKFFKFKVRDNLPAFMAEKRLI